MFAFTSTELSPFMPSYVTAKPAAIAETFQSTILSTNLFAISLSYLSVNCSTFFSSFDTAYKTTIDRAIFTTDFLSISSIN
jgi:hypothetical protein